MTSGIADTYLGFRSVANLAWDHSIKSIMRKGLREMPSDGDIEKTGLFKQIRVQSLSML